MIADFVLMCYNEENSPERACLYMALSAKSSPDYLRYPTFAPLPRSVARCSGCGGSAFEFLLPQWKPVCKRCGAELKLPHITAAPAVPEKQPDIQICEGFWHTALLRSDGTVSSVGNNSEGQCNVQDWSGIRAIAAGKFHTVGLCADGTVKAVGRNDYGQCNVQSWSGICAIAAEDYSTVGLCKDGKVMSTGPNSDVQSIIQSWSNVTHIWVGKRFTAAMTADGTFLCTDPEIQRLLREAPANRSDIQICKGFWHTALLRSDGTVSSVGNNRDGQCDVQDWSGIRAIAAGQFHTVGLCADGTVKAVGQNDFEQCNVEDWSEISVIAAFDYCTVGLRKDGKVMSTGLNSGISSIVQSWSDVTHIWTTSNIIAAMTADGTFLCTDPRIQALLREA